MPEPMTQEELVFELEKAFSADTGLMTAVSKLSDLIDTHADNDFDHYCYIEILEWSLENWRGNNE